MNIFKVKVRVTTEGEPRVPELETEKQHKVKQKR
jgi:hypothetical protein